MNVAKKMIDSMRGLDWHTERQRMMKRLRIKKGGVGKIWPKVRGNSVRILLEKGCRKESNRCGGESAPGEVKKWVSAERNERPPVSWGKQEKSVQNRGS